MLYQTALPELAKAQAAQYDKSMTQYAQYVSLFYPDVLPELGQAAAAKYDKTQTQYAP